MLGRELAALVDRHLRVLGVYPVALLGKNFNRVVRLISHPVGTARIVLPATPVPTVGCARAGAGAARGTELVLPLRDPVETVAAAAL